MADTYNTATIAKLLNLTDRRVQQLASDGVFVRQANGEFRLAETVNAYCRFLQGRESAASTDINEEKRRLTRAQADIVEMNAARRRGELIEIDAAVELVEEALGRVRPKLLGIGATASPRVHLCASAQGATVGDIQSIIDDAVTEALHEIRDEAIGVAALAESPDAEGFGDADGDGLGAAAEAELERVG